MSRQGGGSRATGACTSLPGPWNPHGDAQSPPVPCHHLSCSILLELAACLGFQGLQIKSGAALLLLGKGAGLCRKPGQAAAPQMPAGDPGRGALGHWLIQRGVRAVGLGQGPAWQLVWFAPQPVMGGCRLPPQEGCSCKPTLGEGREQGWARRGGLSTQSLAQPPRGAESGERHWGGPVGRAWPRSLRHVAPSLCVSAGLGFLHGGITGERLCEGTRGGDRRGPKVCLQKADGCSRGGFADTGFAAAGGRVAPGRGAPRFWGRKPPHPVVRCC